MEMEMSNPSSTQLTCDLEQWPLLSPNTSTPPFSDLEKGLNVVLPPLSRKRCIYRVPNRLRCVNEKAYTPQVVSIGPLHHGHESLAAMEEHKIRFASDHLARVEFGLDHYMNIIKDKEEQLRGCYAERIEFSSDEFVRIVLVDALFIIELFLREESVMNYESDYVFGSPYMLADITPDLMLLENQLPFFIFDELFGEKITLLIKLFFYDTLCTREFEILEPELIISELQSYSTINHIVEFVANIEVPTEPEVGQGKVSSMNFPTTTELHQFGVEFKVSNDKKLFDIRFSNGVLEIPKLTIYDVTELKLRNLIAFEQCHYENRYVSDYAIFMSCLVHTCEDVELLVKYKIIENNIGDNSRVATMIYKLGDGVVWSENFNFAQTFNEVNRHCERPWNKHIANLKQNYFNSPWTTIKVIAASLIIILTFIQTVCSIISTVNG